MDRVHTTWAGIIKHLLDRTSPNIIFIWSGEVILGLGFASPNITLPDQINMILVSVLSNKCILFFESGNCFSVLLLTFKEAHCLLYRFVIASWCYLDNYSFVDRQSSASGHYTIDFKKYNKKESTRDKMRTKLACLFVCVCDLNQSTTIKALFLENMQ